MPFVACVWLVAFSRPAAAEAGFMLPPDAGHRDESAPFDLPGPTGIDDAMLHDPSTEGLEAWFRVLGPKKPKQTFGALILQAAKMTVGKPYAPQVELPGIEVVDNNVSAFQCVSLVEGALAMARCTWTDDRTPACFRREVARLRYRHGTMDGFGSRLHYFEDWLADNDERHHLSILTDKLSHHTLTRRTAYMSNHLQAFPGMQDKSERKRIEAVEKRLSHKAVPIVWRQHVSRISKQLIDGDIVAIVTKRPDILIRHVGFVDKDSRGVVHLLHASSLRGQVVRTHEALSDYLKKNAGREGVLVARPLAPKHAHNSVSPSPPKTHLETPSANPTSSTK